MRALLVVAVALALTGCGGSHAPSARDSVTAFLEHENAVQAQMQPSLVAVHQALVDFSKHQTSPTTSKELAKSAQTFRRLRARLATAQPPVQAAKLQRLLLQLVDREVAITDELRQLTVFQPRFVAALLPLPKANAATQKRLSASKSPAVVAATIRRYRAVIERSLAELEPLQPPALERPVFDAQVARLQALDRALGKLAAAAAKGDARAAARAEHDVSVASVSSDSRANQIAQRNAVRAYDRDVAAVSSLALKINAERNRLQVNLS